MLGTLSTMMAIAGLVIKGIQDFATQKAENTRSQEETRHARQAGAYDLSMLMDQIYQAKQATDLQVFERQRQALRDQSRILVSAGEAGVGGNSLLRQIAQQQWDLSHDVGIHRTNLENQTYMTSQQARAVAANIDNRVGTAQARLRNPWVNAMLSIPATAYSIYQIQRGRKGSN